MKDEPSLLMSRKGERMALEGVSARGVARGLAFELAVEQRYRNPLSTNVEAVYTFPLPFEAVLLDVEVEIDGRRLAAAVVEKRAAQARYEEAIDQGDSAIMLERAGDGLCTLNLGNLMAGESATIRYRYAQLLRFQHGSVRLAIPTVIAPRYGDPAAAGLAAHQVPVTDLGVGYPLDLAIELEGDLAAGRLASPSHAIDVARGERGVRVTLARGAFLDRDFVLNVEGLEGRTIATLARDGDGVVALASFCAPVPADAKALPLALKLLVDCSGSMAGDSIAAARRALHRVLMGLDPNDRFALSRFGSQVRHETKGLVAADDAAVRRAAEVLSRMDANLGGTEMPAALRAVFALGGGEGGDVLAITDGEVWDGEGLVAAARAARQRVFVVGIGAAPAEGVLRRLAEASGGACEFVAPDEDVEGAILRTFARVRAPRIASVAITWPAAPLWQAPLPAGLFGGETIHAFAGFAQAPAGEATLALHSARERAAMTSQVRFAGEPVADDTLARIAAMHRLPALDDAAQLELALRYRLLTERTNLLVVAERADAHKARDLPTLARVAQMHAAGWHGMGSVAPSRMDVVYCMNIPADGRIEFDRLDAPEDHGGPASVRRRPAYPDRSHAKEPGADDFATLQALAMTSLPEALREAMRHLADAGFDEQEAFDGLLAVLADRMLASGGEDRQVARRLRRWARRVVDSELRARVEVIVDGASMQTRDQAMALLRQWAAPVALF